MSKPILLTFSDLKKPLLKARKSITEVEDELISPTSLIVQKSLYSYIFSVFEIMLNDLLRITLMYFPEKLSSKEFKFQKDYVLSASNSYELIGLEIERAIQNLAYKSLKEYMDEFCTVTSVDKFDSSLLDQLIERKATRNLLLHNDLVVNDRYIVTAGTLKRSGNYNGVLPLDLRYIIDTVKYTKSAIDHIEQSLTSNFSKYTKVKALKSLWAYLFTSPVMAFDDYWDFTNDSIIALKTSVLRKRMKNNLSSSERKLLAHWITHFNSELNKLFLPEDFSTYTLGDKRKSDLQYLMSVIMNNPDLFKTP